MDLVPFHQPHKLPASAVAAAPLLHVAIISDGNGRWATSQGLPRSAGHRAGAQAARRVIEAAPRLGIHTLTLFALSSANWKRPAAEVNDILRLLHEYLLAETAHCVEAGVRLSVIGVNRDENSGQPGASGRTTISAIANDTCSCN